ncbi:hypothetical protein TNCV_893781 [Trichonephila clavipes]|nr:hypothetical protein TNCV_893781 [Trichonephila clavipes]
MNSYFNEELVYMLIMYGAANCNGLAALRLYRRRHENGRNPHHTTFASVNSSITASALMCVLNPLQNFPVDSRTSERCVDVEKNSSSVLAYQRRSLNLPLPKLHVRKLGLVNGLSKEQIRH